MIKLKENRLKAVVICAGFLGIFSHSLIANAKCMPGYIDLGGDGTSSHKISITFQGNTYQCPVDSWGNLSGGNCGPFRIDSLGNIFIKDKNGNEWSSEIYNFEDMGTTNTYNCSGFNAISGKGCYDIRIIKKLASNNFIGMPVMYTETSYYPYTCSKPPSF